MPGLETAIIFISSKGKQEVDLEKKDLQKQQLPKLPQAQRQTMNEPITTFKIPDTIKKIKIDKAPGPDRFSNQNYVLKTILTITEGCNEHYFARLYNASVLKRSQYCFIAKGRLGCVS